jgi:hypothetical protein
VMCVVVKAFDPFEGLRALCLSEFLADVHFLVRKGKAEERIPAHRLVLAAQNPIFCALLYPLVCSQLSGVFVCVWPVSTL